MSKACTNKDLTLREQNRLARLIRLDRFHKGLDIHPMTAVVKSRKAKAGEVRFQPITDGLGDRSKISVNPGLVLTERQMQAHQKDVNSEELPKVTQQMRAKLQNQTDFLNSYWGWVGIIQPEYELLEPWTIYDTESYLARSVERKKSLMFRNGFRFIGDNETFRSYLEKRFSQLSYMMEQTTENFFKDILLNLLLTSNCIVLKIRDSGASGGKASKKNLSRVPVAAYTVIPSHTIYPYLNGKGRVEKWRRFFADGRTFEDYAIDDIIHFYWDRKPGHIFGTPRTVPVKDDILALRRLEENIELLLIHHLFPLFHVKVGSTEEPADYAPDGSSEIDVVRHEIENMPKEGMFVTDDRVTVEAVGAKSETLDYAVIIKHYKQRIFTGLGISAVDMGEGDSANRSTAEAVSQNLKDGVKSDLDWFCGQVQMLMIRELFQEAPFKLSVQNAVAETRLAFPEIDVDNMIKMENHALNLFNSHLLTEDEARHRMHQAPFSPTDRKKTHYQLHVLNLALALAVAKTKVALEPAELAATPQGKSPKTREQPQNQHGKNLDPHKAKSSRPFNALYDVLQQLHGDLQAEGTLETEWKPESEKRIRTFFDELGHAAADSSYTNQKQMELDQLCTEVVLLAGETQDLDLLFVALGDTQSDWLSRDERNREEDPQRTADQQSPGPGAKSAQGSPGASDEQPG